MSRKNSPAWTEEDLERIRKQHAKPIEINRLPPVVPAPKANPMAGFQALGRIAKGKMNDTEAAYAERLDWLKLTGEILDWKFHVMRIRLADRTYYTPDFLVMDKNREVQIHETKGGWTTEAGQMRIKLAGEALPWFRIFKCIKRDGDSWEIQEFTKK